MGGKKSKLSPEMLTQLKQCTAFTEQELQIWYKGFIRDCPNGQMTQKKFEKVYKNFFPGGDASRFASHVFRTFDKDGSDNIDFREFICGLSITCHGSMDDKLRWAFHMYDIDNSGSITSDELCEIIKSIYRMMGEEDIDLSADNSPEKVSERLFQTMDIDGDGEITMDEFIKSTKDDPTLLKLLQQ